MKLCKKTIKVCILIKKICLPFIFDIFPLYYEKNLKKIKINFCKIKKNVIKYHLNFKIINKEQLYFPVIIFKF